MPYREIAVILGILLVLILVFLVWNAIRKHFRHIDFALADEIRRASFSEKWELLDTLLEPAGFAYDPGNEIFYSRHDAWQRKFGYCRAYDEGASHFSMIFDCEPFYFTYDEKEWLLEFWKGQYGMTTGGEIGLYWRKIDDTVPKSLRHYEAVSDQEMPQMAFRLRKWGRDLFQRGHRHWWLTGFILGEFSKPEQLIMEAEIIFKEEEMAKAVVEAMDLAGYEEEKAFARGRRVYFYFTRPMTRQPFWQKDVFAWGVQLRNRYFCRKYQKMIQGLENRLDSTLDEILYIQRKAPGLFTRMLLVGRNRK